MNDIMNITKEESKLLKGIAISMVVFGHGLNILVPANESFPIIQMLRFSGSWGVSLFLILSGYGLFKSYQSNPSLRNYFKGKINKIMLPYFFVTLIGIISFHKEFNPIFIFSLIGLDMTRTVDATMWYITFILLWYIAFFLVFKFSKIKVAVKIIIIIFIGFFVKYASEASPIINLLDNSGYYGTLYQFNIHCFSFPIGVLLGYLSTYKSWGNKNKVFNGIFITLLLVIIFILTLSKESSNTIYSIQTICVALLFIFNKQLLKIFRKGRILNFIGDYSYEIYLLEGMFFYSLGYINSNIFVKLVIFMETLICSCILLRYLCNQTRLIFSNLFQQKWNTH